jgi:hypothetical protein
MDDFVFTTQSIGNARAFSKEITDIFSNDVLVGFSVAIFTGSRMVMIYTNFENFSEQYFETVVNLGLKYGLVFARIGDIEDRQEQAKMRAELARGDIAFTGLFDIDAAFDMMERRLRSVYG